MSGRYQQNRQERLPSTLDFEALVTPQEGDHAAIMESYVNHRDTICAYRGDRKDILTVTDDAHTIRSETRAQGVYGVLDLVCICRWVSYTCFLGGLRAV